MFLNIHHEQKHQNIVSSASLMDIFGSSIRNPDVSLNDLDSCYFIEQGIQRNH